MNKQYAEETSFNETDIEYFEQDTNIKHSSITQDESRDAISLTQNTDDSVENRYCIFRYYTEASHMQTEIETDKKKSKTSDDCSEFRNAIMKLMESTDVVIDTVEAIQKGTFNKFIFTQKHVGTTSFLTLLSKKCELDYAYIDFFNPNYKEPDNYYDQLCIFVQNYEYTVDNIKRFLISIFKDFELSRRERDLEKGYFKGHKINNQELAKKILNHIESLKIGFSDREKILYRKKNYCKPKKSTDLCENFLTLKNKFLTDKESILSEIEKLLGNEDIEKISKENRISEANIVSQHKLLLIDNFDIALCNMFITDKLPIKKIKDFRNKWITAIKGINTDKNNNLTCVVALRQRDPRLEYRDGISLRRSWDSISTDYVGAFFAELLYVIQNVKNLSIYDSKYSAKSINCYIKDEGENKFCKYSLTKRDFERIIEVNILKNKEERKVDDSLKSKLQFIELCEDNPYFIVRPMIQGLKHNSCVEKNNEFAIDRHIKDWFRDQWESPPQGLLQFDDFLGILPLYLPDDLKNSEYKGIHESAVSFFYKMITTAKGKSIVPYEIINELSESQKKLLLEHDMYKRVVRALKDSYALSEDNAQYNKNKNNENKTELNEYSIHKFVSYVYADKEYFSKI